MSKTWPYWNPNGIVLLVISAAFCHFFSLCLVSDFIIPWKSAHRFYPYACGSQLLWEKLVSNGGRYPQKYLSGSCIAEEFNFFNVLFSALMKAAAIGRYYEILSAFCQLWHVPAAASAGSGTAWAAAQAMWQEKERTIWYKNKKGNHHGCWSWVCLIHFNASRAHTSTLLMLSWVILQKVSY